MGNIHVELPQGTFPTTTTQTTMSPGRFSHNFFHYVKNENDVFRLTIPITLTLFAVVDCTGYLSGNNDNPLRTNENFKEFFKQSIPPLDESDSSFLNHIFRQGLTHIYFPKLSVGISYHSTNPTEKLFFRNGKGVLILNVNRLEEIVTKTFMIIKENESLYPQMEDRYQDLISDYQDKYSATIANYEM